MEIGDKARVAIKDDQFGGRIGLITALNYEWNWALLVFKDGNERWFDWDEIEKSNQFIS